jgi:hypothetical protein
MLDLLFSAAVSATYRINSRDSRNASKDSPLQWLGGVLGGVQYSIGGVGK